MFFLSQWSLIVVFYFFKCIFNLLFFLLNKHPLCEVHGSPGNNVRGDIWVPPYVSRSTQNNLEFNPAYFLLVFTSSSSVSSLHFACSASFSSSFHHRHTCPFHAAPSCLVYPEDSRYLTYLSTSVSCSVPLQFFSILASPVQFCMLYLFYPLPVCLIKKLLLAHILVNLSFRYLCFLPPFTFNS